MATNAELTAIFRARDEMQAVTGRIEGHLKRIEGGLNGVLGTAAKLGAATVAVQAVGNAIGAAGERVGGLVRQASDVNEAVNRIDVVFGGAAESVKRFTDDSAEALGLSQRAALAAAGDFGNLFTSMQIGEGRAAEMSKELLALSADLASFNNITVDEALIKLRAGLVGETEPLRTLGVNLTAATVEAKALEMGLAKQGDTLTAAGKAQAAYALILEQTKNAQGDFARTSDGLANSTRTLEARWGDLQARLGTGLLPLAQTGVGVLSEFLRTMDQSGQAQRFTDSIAMAGRGVQEFLQDVQGLSSGQGLNALDATLTTIASRLRTGFGDEAGRAFEQITRGIGNASSELGTFLNSRVIPTARELATLATNLSSAAQSGARFEATIGPSGRALDVMRLALERVNPLLRDHGEILAGIAAGAGALVALRAVAPIITGIGVALGTLASGAGIAGLVSLVNPVTAAIALLATGVGLLTAAWIGNWGDIQTKTEVAGRVIGTRIQNLRDDLGDSGLKHVLAELARGFTLMATEAERSVARVDASLNDLPERVLSVAREMGGITGSIARGLESIGIAAERAQQAVAETSSELESVGRQIQDERRLAALTQVDQALAEQQRRTEQGLQQMLARSRAENAAVLAQQRAAQEAAAAAQRTPIDMGSGITAIPKQEDMNRAKTAIQGFMAELSRNAVQFERMFGELGGRAATALVTALEENTEGAGAALARSIQDITQALERAGLPDFQSIADRLAGSFHDALVDRGNPALRAAALEMLGEVTRTLESSNALSPESFARAFDVARLRSSLGSGGAQIMDALETAIREGGARNIEALASTVEGMRRTLFEDRDLQPERVREHWVQLWNRVNGAIRAGSAEARAELQRFLADFNFDIATEKLGRRMDEQISEAAKQAADAIKQAGEQAQRQINEAFDRLAESRSLRDARENVARVQAEELQNVINMLDRARLAWRDYREEQEIGRRREREDAELTRRRLQEDAEIARRMREGQRSQMGRNPAPADVDPSIVGARPDPMYQAFLERQELARRRQQEDSDRARTRSQEDADLARRRQEREQDAAHERNLAEILATFRTQQAANLQAFMDRQEDEGLGRQIVRINQQRDEAIRAAGERLAEVTTKEQAAYDAEIARLTALREAADAVYDGMLADIEESNRLRREIEKPSEAGGGGGGGALAPATGGAGEGRGGRQVSLTLQVNAPIIGVPGGLDTIYEYFAARLREDIEGATVVSGGAT